MPLSLLLTLSCSEHKVTAQPPVSEAPVVTILSPAEGGSYSSSGLTLSALVQDDLDPPEELELVWTSSLEGELALSLTLSSDGMVVGQGDLQPGTHQLILSATDSEGGVGIDSVEVELWSAEDSGGAQPPVNTPPTRPELLLEPSHPTEDLDDLRCSILTPSLDLDGDLVSYRFDWEQDGRTVSADGGDATSSWIVAGAPRAGELWTCRVTPSDGMLDGASASASVEIESARDSGLPSDSGTAEDEDGPGEGGTVVEGSRRVFVTSSMVSGALGGLSGADDLCQEHADRAGLGGHWRAWLSDSTSSAEDRLVHPNGPLLRTDGSELAASWEALVASYPVLAPELDEYGAQVPYQGGGSSGTGCSWSGGYFFFPWTGTSNSGGQRPEFCSDWTSDSSSLTGRVGLGGYSVSQWTDWCDFTCDTQAHLYCFEQ